MWNNILINKSFIHETKNEIIYIPDSLFFGDNGRVFHT
jgi:hypothetical protein